MFDHHLSIHVVYLSISYVDFHIKMQKTVLLCSLAKIKAQLA